MSDSPFHLSSLCSTPLFGGMDFLGCPVNMCDGNMDITEFLDPGEFSMSSEEEDEMFERRKINLQPAMHGIHDEMAGDISSSSPLSEATIEETRLYQKSVQGAATNWPGLQRSDKQSDQNGLIKEGERGMPCSLSQHTSAVNTSNCFAPNFKDGKHSPLRPLKGHFLSSKTSNSRQEMKKDKNGRMSKDNEVYDKQAEKNDFVNFEKKDADIPSRTEEQPHEKTARVARHKNQSKTKSVVAKSQYLSFVNVRPAWSYSNSQSRWQLDKYNRDEGFSKWPIKGAKNSENAHKHEWLSSKKTGKREAGANSLRIGRSSVPELAVPISRVKTEFLNRSLMNSVSLPAINTSLAQTYTKKERANVEKLPSLSSKDMLLGNKGKHLGMIEGKSLKATSRSKNTIDRSETRF